MKATYFKDIYKFLSKKHPNRKIYVISDHHFYHSNIILYERPEFNDVEKMNEHIIKVHNETVTPNDIVIFLGDFSFKKSAIKELLERMNGFKYLLIGNHDNSSWIKYYIEMGFEGVFTTPIKIGSKYLSHEPLEQNDELGVHFKLLVQCFNDDSNGYNYHGHIHTTEQANPPFCNVTCEAIKYKPMLIGYTEGYLDEFDSPLIINENQFTSILELLKREKNLNPNILITDYIYSLMLEANSPYMGCCFIYGSFPLYKKFGYVSNFSDLDVGLIYNDQVSKNRNIQTLKETVDRMYASVLDIDGINLSFIKRLVNMCAFEALYTSKPGFYSKCALDTNLIPYNPYRESDFIPYYGKTTIEKMLEKEYPDILEGIQLPRYQAQVLTSNGDMANLVLQILFQKGYEQKKVEALKKLKYVFKHFGNNNLENIKDLEDILTRFFIRNILFFHTLRRANDIEYIKEAKLDINHFLKSLPIPLALQLEEILKNPNSEFNIVLNEIMSSKYQDIPEVGKTMIYQRKNN